MTEPTCIHSLKTQPGDWAGPNDPARCLWGLWRRGQQPSVEDFLARVNIRDPDRIVAVLRVDQWERCRLGRRVPAEAYLDAFPAVRDEAEHAVELILAEYLLREELGEHPALEEYLGRFPQYAGTLQLQLELHRAMSAHREPLTDWAERTMTLGDRRESESACRVRRTSRHPRLRGPGCAGPRGHGGRLPGLAAGVEPLGGSEDGARGGPGRPDGAVAVPRRGRGGGPVAAPQHRPGPRGGAARRLAVPGARAGGGGRPVAPDRRHAAAGPMGRGAGRDAGTGHRRGAPAGGRPPRPDPGQRPPDRRWPAQDHRFRPGQADHRRWRLAHPDRRAAGHAQLHGAGTGGQPAPGDRGGDRRLRPGCDPLRTTHRPAAVQGGIGPGDPAPGRGP